MAFSNLEKAMAAVIGLDIARPGTSRAAAKRAVEVIARGAVRAAPVAAQAARVNPYAAAGLTGLAAYELGLLDPLAAPTMQAAEMATEAAQEILIERPERTRKKRRTTFNKAVSAGMKAVKQSTSYGKKGTINNAKKAFSAVNKVASKLNKGQKVSTKGPTGVIKRAISKFFPKKKPVRRRNTTQYSIKVNR
jgi:preprotein translocase subunit YajC